MSEPFPMPGEGCDAQVTVRRSIGRMADAVRIDTPNYDDCYINTELRRKRMIPIITRIRAKSLRIRRARPPHGRGGDLRDHRPDRGPHRVSTIRW